MAQHTSISRPKAIANARLIAAAPALLAFVRAYVESSPGVFYKRWIHPDTLWNQAVALLAKVEDAT